MKSLILTALTLTSAAQAQRVDHKALERAGLPLVYVNPRNDPKEALAAVNAVNNAVAYALVTNGIKNGSGVEANAPLAQQTYFTQGLRQLSLMDLHLAHTVNTQGLRKANFNVDIVPYTEFAGVFFENQNVNIPGLQPAIANFLEPIIAKSKMFIKPNPSYSKPFSRFLRQAQIVGLQRVYPVVPEGPTNDPKARTRWLVGSFLPVGAHVDINVNGGRGIGSTTLIFPAFGVPDKTPEQLAQVKDLSEIKLRPLEFSSRVAKDAVGYMPPAQTQIGTIHNIAFKSPAGNTQARAIKVKFWKDYSRPDDLYGEVSFGYLAPEPNDGFAMNVDESTGAQLAKEVGYGVIASGDMKLDSSLVKNAKALEVSEKYTKMIDFKIGIHKLAFRLKHSPYVDNGKLANIQYWADAVKVFDQDPGFRIENFQMIPEKSVLSFRLSIKPEYFNKLKDLTFWQGLQDKEKALQHNFLKAFCGMSDAYAKEKITLMDILTFSRILQRRDLPPNCEVTTTSLAEFKKQLFSSWLNKTISLEVDKGVASSVDQQAVKGGQEVDKLIQQVVVQVLAQLQETRAQIASKAPQALFEGL